MGGGDINVAYEGTFGDLSVGGDATLFGHNPSYDDWQDILGSTDSMPSTQFTAVNDSATNDGTISPKDLFNDSVPPSTSFTDLTTPGSTMLETPDDGYESSPLFNDSFTTGHAGGDQWFSLFPEESNTGSATPAPLMARTSSSSPQVMIHRGGEGHHKRSSTTNISPTVRLSQIAGVNARKRDKPLPPIFVDENDPIAVKRARNTAAARKSREKKMQERDTYLADIEELKAQVEHWKALALGRAALTDEGFAA